MYAIDRSRHMYIDRSSLCVPCDLCLCVFSNRVSQELGDRHAYVLALNEVSCSPRPVLHGHLGADGAEALAALVVNLTRIIRRELNRLLRIQDTPDLELHLIDTQ